MSKLGQENFNRFVEFGEERNALMSPLLIEIAGFLPTVCVVIKLLQHRCGKSVEIGGWLAVVMTFYLSKRPIRGNLSSQNDKQFH